MALDVIVDPVSAGSFAISLVARQVGALGVRGAGCLLDVSGDRVVRLLPAWAAAEAGRGGQPGDPT